MSEPIRIRPAGIPGRLTGTRKDDFLSQRRGIGEFSYALLRGFKYYA